MTELFPEDQKAKELHSLGIHLATKEFDFAGAHEANAHSLEILRAKRADTVSDHTSIEAVSLSVQEARIIRDDAFVHTREGIVSADFGQLTTAGERLFAAHFITYSLLDDRRAFTKEQKAFLLSEHGATKTLIGRTATVWAAMNGEEPQFIKINQTADDFYTEARSILRNGSNRYYEASNAINAARSARFEGNWARTAVWLGMTAVSIMKARNDPANLRPAIETVSSRLPHLATRTAARISILAKP